VPHFSGTFVHINAKIGKNCTLGHGVSIGIQPRGPKAGCPVIGDSVYISPGAKIIGNVRIGNNALIGVNAVVTFDVPDDGVVAAEASKIVSYNGSAKYIVNA
jgi:serine O-acetyltransferase